MESLTKTQKTDTFKVKAARATAARAACKNSCTQQLYISPQGSRLCYNFMNNGYESSPDTNIMILAHTKSNCLVHLTTVATSLIRLGKGAQKK